MILRPQRVHLLTYPVARKENILPPKLHARRDCNAAWELLFPLYQQGYHPGEQLLAQPPRHKPQGVLTLSELFRVDMPFVLPKDLIVLTTRLPMHDRDAGPQKQVERAYTDLELRIFTAVQQAIEYCARTDVLVAEQYHNLLRKGYEDRRHMTFKQKGWGAPYDELNAHAGRGARKYKGKRRTALFLVRIEALYEGGPDLLLAFGMDGCCTMVWCYRLARDFAHLLTKPGFVVAELELGRLPERPTDLRWCLDWKIEILLQHEGPLLVPTQA